MVRWAGARCPLQRPVQLVLEAIRARKRRRDCLGQSCASACHDDRPLVLARGGELHGVGLAQTAVRARTAWPQAVLDAWLCGADKAPLYQQSKVDRKALRQIRGDLGLLGLYRARIPTVSVAPQSVSPAGRHAFGAGRGCCRMSCKDACGWNALFPGAQGKIYFLLRLQG